jgi:hypothetical protein
MTIDTSAIDIYLSGQFVNGTLQTYSRPFGGIVGVDGEAIFLMFIYVMVVMALYITNQDITMPSMISLVFGWALSYSNRFGPEAERIGYLIVVFGVAGVMFKIRSVRRI